MADGLDPALLKAFSRIIAERKREQHQEQQSIVPPRLATWHGFDAFCREQLKVLDPEKRLVPFRLRPLQRAIVAREIRMRRAGRTPWFIVLKYRKGGVTTLQQALAYWTIWKERHQECFTIAHRPGDMRIIFRHVERFYEHQPAFFRHRKSSAVVNWIEFPDWDGLYMAGSAGAVSAGRGTTLSRVHLSEAAFFSDLPQLHTSLSNSLAKRTGAYVIESTPNGRIGDGEAFYNFWQTAKRGESEFIPLFFPWHSDPANQIPLLWAEELDPLTDEEEKLRLMHNLSLAQIKWWRTERRRIVADGGAADRIHQEHPSDDESCFLLGTEGYYDPTLLADLHGRTREPLRVEDNGRLRIYEDPQEHTSYVIGVDPAGGVGGDDSAAVGFNTRTGRQAFSYQSNRIPPDDLGAVILGARQGGLGWRYAVPGTDTPAYIVVERNNHGHATLTGLLKLANYPRERVYHHIDPTQDPSRAIESKSPGWPNNPTSHGLLTAAIGKMVRDGDPKIMDAQVLYSIGEVGSGPNGAEFKGRDLAVAAGLAVLGYPFARDAGSRYAWIGGQIMEL
jgi:hypothetical protein